MADPSCEELFQRLLALDHSRQEPWGPLHGIAVACYRLQHPGSLTDGSHAFPLELLQTYVKHGLDAALRLTEHARRANSHRALQRKRAALASPPEVPAGFTVTIADVAVDGHFPADGYPERVHSWAEATLASWHS